MGGYTTDWNPILVAAGTGISWGVDEYGEGGGDWGGEKERGVGGKDVGDGWVEKGLM